ncbi:MAG TPA: GGDEF domain-containing response regulator [Polyangiaceae bacterium]
MASTPDPNHGPGEVRAPRERLRILLIEDNPPDAFFLREVLGDGAEVACVPSLGQALTRLVEEDFDIIVTELTLPDADSFEAIRALESTAPKLPVLVLSDLQDEHFALRAVATGAQDYMIKGQTNPHVLRRAIHHSIARKHTEQRLIRLAHYDQLTGLPNRLLYHQRVANAAARARRADGLFAVMLLDLDHFKPINDAHGHMAGDIVLQKVAAALTGAVRDGDTVARLGGDEFAVLLDPIEHAEDPIAVVERLSSAIASPIRLDDGSVSTTASIGIAVYPGGGVELDGLLKSADAAMYAAKGQGRNSYRVWTPSNP